MENTNKFLNMNQDKIPEQYEFLQLAKKSDDGKKIYTGKHILKIVSDEKTTKKNAIGVMEEVMRYKFVEKLENGTYKNVQYDFPCWAKDKAGEQVHYMLPKMNQFSPDDIITLEMIPNGLKAFINAEKYIEGKLTPENIQKNTEEELPIIQEGEIPVVEDDEFSIPASDNDNIDIKDIPF